MSSTPLKTTPLSEWTTEWDGYIVSHTTHKDFEAVHVLLRTTLVSIDLQRWWLELGCIGTISHSGGYGGTIVTTLKFQGIYKKYICMIIQMCLTCWPQSYSEDLFHVPMLSVWQVTLILLRCYFIDHDMIFMMYDRLRCFSGVKICSMSTLRVWLSTDWV